MRLDQRKPGTVAVEKGISTLLAGLNDRDPGRRWRVASPPDRLEHGGAMGAGNVDLTRVVGPDDQHPLGNVSTPRTATDEDVADHPAEEVA